MYDEKKKNPLHHNCNPLYPATNAPSWGGGGEPKLPGIHGRHLSLYPLCGEKLLAISPFNGTYEQYLVSWNKKSQV